MDPHGFLALEVVPTWTGMDACGLTPPAFKTGGGAKAPPALGHRDRLGLVKTPRSAHSRSTIREARWLPVAALAVGVLVGASVTFLVGRSSERVRPSETTVTGTVGVINSSRTGFSFVTDDGANTSFSMASDDAAVIRPGAHLSLLVVSGDGYQIVARASPT